MDTVHDSFIEKKKDALVSVSVYTVYVSHTVWHSIRQRICLECIPMVRTPFNSSIEVIHYLSYVTRYLYPKNVQTKGPDPNFFEIEIDRQYKSISVSSLITWKIDNSAFVLIIKK